MGKVISRLAVVFLVVAIACSISSAKYSGGTGEPNDPYLIATPSDLNAIGADHNDWDKHFKMTADINMADITGSQFHVIGNSTNSFTGVFDGNNFKIINFTYSTATLDNIGLFGVIEGPACIIKNIKLEDIIIYTSKNTAGSLVGLVTNQALVTNCSVQNGLVDGSNDIGGLAGANEGGIVSYCRFEGVVEASSTVGGLVGDNSFDSTISHSFTEGTVIGFAAVGGLVGENSFNSVISQCYSLSDVKHGANAHLYFGGLVGTNSIMGSIIDCYAYGNVTGGGRTGGFVGSNDNFIKNCYSIGQVTGTSAVGGFAGENEGTIMNSFWNTDTCSQFSSVGLGSGSGITGINTSLMLTETTFIDAFWDFSTPIWRICEGNTYPFLAWTGYFCDYHDSGSGERNDPYIIWSNFQFNDIGNHPDDWDKHFILVNDINMARYSSDQFNPIGFSGFDSQPFSGSFDGNHHIITNVTCLRDGISYYGIFEYITGEIKNLTFKNCLVNAEGNGTGILAGKAVSATITDCNVVNSTVIAGFRGGGLIGTVEDSSIADCSVQDSSVSSRSSYAGGLIGDIEGSYVIRSFSTATVFERTQYSRNYGGLIGHAEFTTVSQCYATGDVTANSTAGGLVGHIKNSVFIEDCYATGDVESIDPTYTYIGGFIGIASEGCIIDNSYSTGHLTWPGGAYSQSVGGFIALGSASVNNCFWDKDTSGVLLSDGGIPKTTAEMQTQSTFTDAGWDFVGELNNGGFDIWAMPEEQGYPLIWWQLDPLPDLHLFSGGSGTSSEPFLVSNAIEFAYLCNSRLTDKYFKLIDDIDCNTFNSRPIGTKLNCFTGGFDGNDHSIYNLQINEPEQDYTGMFGHVGTEARIINVTIIDANILGKDYTGGLIGFNKGAAISGCRCVADVTGNDYTGGLIGYNEYGPVSDCQATGKVSGHRYVGGLIGKASQSEISGCSSNSVSSSTYIAGGLIGHFVDSNMTDCSSSGSVAGSGSNNGGLIGRGGNFSITRSNSSCNVSGTDSVGGLIGSGYSGVVHMCYSDGSISGQDNVGGIAGYCSGEIFESYSAADVDGHDYVGGFVGKNSARLLNCYAVGDVNGIERVGGLNGSGGECIAYCYSTGKVSYPNDANYAGGLFGQGYHRGISCYWDIQTSGQTQSSGGKGKTTEEMFDKDTYIGWGCEPSWLIHDGLGYPHLSWQDQTGEQLTIPQYSAGTGTPEDPFLISTAQQLNSIGLTTCHQDKSFRLISDIDMSEIDCNAYNAIGPAYQYYFTGTFDGNGHAVLNFKMNMDASKFGGFFRRINDPNAIIMNLDIIDPNLYAQKHSRCGCLAEALLAGTITNCRVIGGSIKGESVTGGLVGHSYDRITDCFSSADVSIAYDEYFVGGLVGVANGAEIINCHTQCDVTGGGCAGGITGANEGDGLISNCSATGDVSGQRTVGGLVGVNRRYASIENSYAKCNVNGLERIGGLVGFHQSPLISNCYAIGSVHADKEAGGLLGYTYTDVYNCYAVASVDANQYAGGFVGYEFDNMSDFRNCFWDVNLCPELDGIGNSTDPNVTGLSTNQMQMRDTFINSDWDFNNIWDICEGTNYPRLIWQIPSGDFLCQDGVNFIDYAHFGKWWLYDTCSADNDFCRGADFDMSGIVDEQDAIVFCNNWLEGLGP